MQIATAIKQIQTDAEFLCLGLLEMMQFIQKDPLAQTHKTLEAYNVIKFAGAKFFA